MQAWEPPLITAAYRAARGSAAPGLDDVDSSILSLLLEHCKISHNRTEAGHTALHLACAELAKRGLPRHHAQTPHEFARGQAGRLEGVRHLSNLFVRARYGPGAISEADTAKARHLFEVVRGGLRG